MYKIDLEKLRDHFPLIKKHLLTIEQTKDDQYVRVRPNILELLKDTFDITKKEIKHYEDKIYNIGACISVNRQKCYNSTVYKCSTCKCSMRFNYKNCMKCMNELKNQRNQLVHNADFID